jgi:glycosyltransferase involved in cell wall biosynthesis
LFLSYDGLTDPLGRSQILPYLAGLSKRGHDISVISFEKPGKANQFNAVAAACEEAGIAWHPATYHARPPVVSTMFDIWRMRRSALRLHRQRPFEIVHCRSYIAALVGLGLKREHGVRFLFDMRGFYVDERIEMGLWRVGHPIYDRIIAYFRKREAEFFREADAVVSLTHSAVPKLSSMTKAPVTVIPCCVDFDEFRPAGDAERSAARHELGLPAGIKVLGYLGSAGSNYLLDEMFDAFTVYREQHPGAKFLFLSPDEPDFLTAGAARHGIAADELVIRSVSRADVARLMPAADDGVSFIRPGQSKLACCPTKLGEMMALGIPLIVNGEIGDVDEIIRESQGGVIVSEYDPATLSAAVRALAATERSAQRIRSGARQWFDLASGLNAYHSIYRGLVR